MAESRTDERSYPPGDDGADPPYLHPDYGSTVKRSPSRPLIEIEHTVTELSGLTFEPHDAGETDLTKQAGAKPIGECIDVQGRVLDEDGRPYAGALVELWQANAAGRYRHPDDNRDVPLDPNFVGMGRCVTDTEGRYFFRTIRPGAYPPPVEGWWRPAHLHFSVTGPSLAARLVTQMYFPGDPMLPYDSIYMSVADEAARERLVAQYDPDLGVWGESLGYRFDLVLRGRTADSD